MAMNLLNNAEGNNYITEDDHSKHVIKKYEFQSMDKKLEAQIAPAMEEKGIYTPKEESRKIEGMDFLQEQLSRTLEENQKIFQKLEFFQDLLQKQNQIDPAILEELKQSSFQQGYNQAEQKLREDLQSKVLEQKEKMIFAIQELERVAQNLQEQVVQIRDDLSSIALDLAKEVILKEVQEHGSKIALMIASELLKPLEKSANITLKAHPLDLPLLQEKLTLSNITFEADVLVGRGGVIVISPNGNLDGSILSRYKNLKRSILDEKGL